MIKNLNNILVKIYYDCLPVGFRKFYGPIVEAFYSIFQRICAIASDLYVPVTLLTSNGTDDSPHILLHIAGRGDISPFLLNQMNLLESKTTNQVSQGRMCLWNVPSKSKGKVNASIIEADRCFSPFLMAGGYIPIPEWVLFTLDLSMPAEDIFKRYKKRDDGNYRKIKKHQYTYEVMQDIDKISFFYHRMYVPHIKSRHGKLAHIASYGYMKNLMQYGELLFVKLANEYVGGLMINTASSPPILAFMGIKDGRHDYIKQGAASALYYFAILWAKKKGYTKLDCGHCRPLLHDGVLQYKKRWGMHIRRSPRKHRVLYLSFGRSNDYLKQFFINNPLIYEDQGHLKGLLILDNETIHTKQSIEAAKNKYAMPGLKDFSVVLYNAPLLLQKSKQW